MNTVTLEFTWEPQGPLLIGAGGKQENSAARERSGERKVAQFRSLNEQQKLTPSLLASSVKGVFRSAAAWLVEREGQIAQGGVSEHRYITADYANALLSLGPLTRAVGAMTGVDRLCPVGRAFGGPSLQDADADSTVLRRQGLMRFYFTQPDLHPEAKREPLSDALFGRTVQQGNQYFAYQKGGETGKPLETERLVIDNRPRMVIQVGEQGHRDATADQRLAVALVCLSADLISTGFFRFGRFTSRGYGWVRLTGPRGRALTLAALMDGEKAAWRQATNGAALARDLLDQDPHEVVRDAVRGWVQEVGR